MPNLSRRHLVTTAAALPALAVPAAAATLAQEPDPIFAAIEKHRRACAETTAAFARETGQEHELISITDKQDDIAIDLLHIQPTTVAGAAAVLSYFVKVEATGEQVFPENLDDDGNKVDAADISGYESPPAFGYLLARNVARALAQMAV
ncbi:MAG: hypothetical protein WAN65_23570 [Candidatus Sulfotelmatobacter sp.]